MVLRQRPHNMSSDQPLKKKPKRDDVKSAVDEPDFIANFAETGVQSNLQALHLSIPANVNEDDINSVNLQYSKGFHVPNGSETDEKPVEDTSTTELLVENVPIPPAPNISDVCSVVSVDTNLSDVNVQCVQDDTLNEFQQSLIKQCLCGSSETILYKAFNPQDDNNLNVNRSITMSIWPTHRILQFLSDLQLLFDVYLKQNNKGFICSNIITNCEMVIYNEYNLIEQIISLCEVDNKFVHYLAARVLSSFLIMAKTNINNQWLETLLNFLVADGTDYAKMNFSLEVIKKVIERKDVEIHVLEEVTDISQHNSTCTKVPFRDSESFDTTAIKGLIIRSLVPKWLDLVQRIQVLITSYSFRDTQTCILTFLALWEKIISVKANLSVIDIKPFYAQLETFVSLLNGNLPPIIWKQILSLFNEVLCYGSTLALQDMVPDDTCQLAHLVVRYVKDYRLLDSLPFRQNPGNTINSFVGPVPTSEPSQSNIDRTLLQKMVLLVIKSVAVTVKETRSDSSDSSTGSDDFDFYQDMQLIERCIRDVLRKVDIFVKNALDFHPESLFCKNMIHLFTDQDNYLIESMVCTLDISVGISYRNAIFPDLVVMLNPSNSFIEFLKVVNHDSDVLLDYLVGSETCFLLYLLIFLKYIKKNWSKFVSSCSEGSALRNNELGDTMAVLHRLNTQIDRLVSRELFPYNINPILKLLTQCENLYHGNEYS